jgi:hypothetical protein
MTNVIPEIPMWITLSVFDICLLGMIIAIWLARKT